MKQLSPAAYIVIEGNIGAGKTSLAKILANKFNSDLVLEQFADNTFLPQFYEQPERFAFPLEMSFLAERFQQIKQHQDEAIKKKRPLISDYLFEKSLLFAKVTLSGPELDLFTTFYKLINPTLRKPDLIVYLHRSIENLLDNIQKRGRDFEKEIPAAYLERVSKEYINHLQSLENQRVLFIHSDDLDFVNNPVHLRFILASLSAELPEKYQEISF